MEADMKTSRVDGITKQIVASSTSIQNNKKNNLTNVLITAIFTIYQFINNNSDTATNQLYLGKRN